MPSTADCEYALQISEYHGSNLRPHPALSPYALTLHLHNCTELCHIKGHPKPTDAKYEQTALPLNSKCKSAMIQARSVKIVKGEWRKPTYPHVHLIYHSYGYLFIYCMCLQRQGKN